MSDGPETIYTNKSATMIITPPAIPLHETDLAWRRDDLPATDAQIKANPKVQGLVEACERADSYIEKGMFDRSGPVLRQLRAALAALEAPVRCAECDCKNGGADCNWIAKP